MRSMDLTLARALRLNTGPGTVDEKVEQIQSSGVTSISLSIANLLHQ